MTDKCETCRDCSSTIPLSSLNVSNLYAILCGCYRSPNVKNRMCELCKFSQIRSHISKCKHLSLGSPSVGRTYYTFKNDLENIIIQQPREERDLGITFSGDFKFSKHINLSIHKANKMLGIIYLRFQHLTPTVFRLLYVSLVRPHLDYASSIWNPHLLKDIRVLEAVQRCATRMVPKFDTMSYIEKLTFLNLPSLYYRRKRMDMIIT